MSYFRDIEYPANHELSTDKIVSHASFVTQAEQLDFKKWCSDNGFYVKFKFINKTNGILEYAIYSEYEKDQIEVFLIDFREEHHADR